MERTFVAIDLEMTGLAVGEDEIIEVGAVRFQRDRVIDTFQTLVKPRRPLPLKITRITGITANELTSAPTFNDIAPALVRFMGNAPLVGHAAARDLEMLHAQGLSVAQPLYDTFELATLLLPRLTDYKLGTIAEHWSIELTDAHRALADADVTRQVFLRLLDTIEHMPLLDLEQALRLLQR